MTGRILHFGLGAFHRAHQAAFTQDAGGGWRITAVAMRNPALADAMNAAGGRWHLVERAPEGPRLREMAVIDRALCLASDPRWTVAQMADPAVRVVTVTVTEKGYGLDPVTRRLDPAHPAVAADLAAPEAPRGLVGALVEGLRLRRAAGLGGVTVMSCDNLSGNGRLLAGLVDDFARARGGSGDVALADWIAGECAFPDSMVDRITPASTAETLAIVRKATGQDDPLAVETEPFRQWVIEDRFAGPRPAWEAAGAEIVGEVGPHEVMKLRMLNGAHSLIAYMGALAGCALVRDVMAVPVLRGAVARHMLAAAATLPAGLDPGGYAGALMARFDNPAIRHLCLQIATDGSQKLPQRIFAAAEEALARGADGAEFAFATAVWVRFLQGRADDGAALVPNDPLAGPLMRAAAGGDDAAVVAAVAGCLGLAGRGPFAMPGWVARVAADLAALRAGGVMAACAGRA